MNETERKKCVLCDFNSDDIGLKIHFTKFHSLEKDEKRISVKINKLLKQINKCEEKMKILQKKLESFNEKRDKIIKFYKKDDKPVSQNKCDHENSVELNDDMTGLGKCKKCGETVKTHFFDHMFDEN